MKTWHPGATASALVAGFHGGGDGTATFELEVRRGAQVGIAGGFEAAALVREVLAVLEAA